MIQGPKQSLGTGLLTYSLYIPLTNPLYPADKAFTVSSIFWKENIEKFYADIEVKIKNKISNTAFIKLLINYLLIRTFNKIK